MRLLVLAATALALSASPSLAKGPVSEAQIKQAIIQDSIDSYPGNCPCPYNSARNGSRCGGRSAWSRAGGYAPMCYPSDVTKAQVQAYRANH